METSICCHKTTIVATSSTYRYHYSQWKVYRTVGVQRCLPRQTPARTLLVCFVGARQELSAIHGNFAASEHG